MTDEQNRRRGELIRRKIDRRLTWDEEMELARLQEIAEQHRRAVGPLPTETIYDFWDRIGYDGDCL